MIARKVRCKQKCGPGRSGRVWAFRAMRRTEAARLQVGDPVSVLVDGRRAIAVVVKAPLIRRNLFVDLASDLRVIRDRSYGKTMGKLVVPVVIPKENWQVGADASGLDF